MDNQASFNGASTVHRLARIFRLGTLLLMGILSAVPVGASAGRDAFAGTTSDGSPATLIQGAPQCPDKLSDLALNLVDGEKPTVREGFPEGQFELHCTYGEKHPLFGSVPVRISAKWTTDAFTQPHYECGTDWEELIDNDADSHGAYRRGEDKSVEVNISVIWPGGRGGVGPVDPAAQSARVAEARRVGEELLALISNLPTVVPCRGAAGQVLPPAGFEQCFVRGTVVDAGAKPEGPVRSEDGHPLAGVRVSLTYDDPAAWFFAGTPIQELKVTATDHAGRYEFFVVESDLPAGFDVDNDTLRVRLRLQAWELHGVTEFGHEPAIFEVFVTESIGRIHRTSLLTDRFDVSPTGDCDEGVVERDFDLGNIPPSYTSQHPFDRRRWPAIGEIYDRTWRASTMFGLLKIAMDYGTPLHVYTFTGRGDLAFFTGRTSNNLLTSVDPYIDISDLASRLSDLGWPDNREYHEMGHYFMANAFGHALPAFSGDVNHAGYEENTSTTDSWVEGFAEFFSTMVSKHVDGEPRPELYRWRGGPTNLELDQLAWEIEEFAVAGVLLDLEDGPEDYEVVPSVDLDLRVIWFNVLEEARHGRLLVGEVVNASRPVTGAEVSRSTTVTAVFRDASDQAIFVLVAETVPSNIRRNHVGFFAIPVPADLDWETLDVTATSGPPEGALGDDDPVNLTLQEVWDTIRGYTSYELESNGFLFDVLDLYTAFRERYPDLDNDADGMNDIDQVFVSHGFFADPESDRIFQPGDPIGRTDHPPFIPRRAAPPLPGGFVRVDTGAVDAAFLVHVSLPPPREYAGYSYVTRPDAQGRIYVTVPPKRESGTATIIALAQGFRPRIVGVIDSERFWPDFEAAGRKPFLSFEVDLEPGDINASTGPSVAGIGLVALGGVLAVSGAGLLVLRRTRGRGE